MNSNETIISVEGLEHSYSNTKVLKGLNFTVEKGKIFGLFGRNGSGKTTTINILMGFLTPSSGKCLIYNEPSDRLSSENKKKIGLLHEGHISYDFMTINQSENFYKGFYENWDSKIFDYFIKKLGLPRDRKVKHMSCGQRSQVALAILMAQGSETLILDDFSMGLDAGYRRLFLDHLNKFARELNKTVLITSHIVQDLEKFVDEAVIIDKGKVLVSAPLNHLKDGLYGYKLPIKDEVNKRIESLKANDKILDISLSSSSYEVISRVPNSEASDFFKNANIVDNFEEYEISFEDAFIALTGKY